MSEGKDYYEINIVQLIRALWRKLWLIILAAVIGAAGLFSYAAFVITPTYKSETLFYVNNSTFSLNNAQFSISSADITAAKSLVDTYIVILKTRSTLNEVIEEAGVDYTYGELRSMISASAVDSTEIFKISVISEDPKEAELLANTIARVLPYKIADIVDGSSVRIVDYAVMPSAKDSPNVTRYTALGFMAGLILACGVIVIREILDTQIHSEEYLIQTYGLPVLAVVPALGSNPKGSGYYGDYAKKEEGK